MSFHQRCNYKAADDEKQKRQDVELLFVALAPLQVKRKIIASRILRVHGTNVRRHWLIEILFFYDAFSQPKYRKEGI